MGPKKQKQEEWNECLKCNRVIHKRDIPQHTEDCNAVHGYVLDKVLHAQICAPSSHTKDALSKISLQNQEGVVLVNVSVMGLCDLAIGQPCLVNNHHVLTSWPSDKVSPTGVLLPSVLRDIIAGPSGDKDTTPVTVRRFFPPANSEAQQVEVELEWEHEAFQTEEFRQVLKHKMEGRFITKGMKQTIQYFGHRCTFCVTEIQRLQLPVYRLNSSTSSSPSSRTDPSQLSQSLASLDISGVSDSGDSLNSSVLSSPSRQSGSVRTAEACSSPLPTVTTPVGSQWPQQFCTPVLDRNLQDDKDCAEFVKVVSQTQFVIRRECSEEEEREKRQKKITFNSIGGLDAQITNIRDYCHLLLQYSKQSSTAVQMMPQGILLFGPTGTGKSLLAQATASELDIYTTHISPVNIFSKFLGETEKRLRSAFEAAHQRSPSLIIIDNIDVLCPRKDSNSSDLEKRTLNTFLSLMDSVTKKSSKELCIIIGITSKADVLDTTLRRASRFGMEVETGVPTVADRFQILKKLLQDVPHTVSDSDLKSIADSAHGYVGADLAGVASKARQHLWERTQDAGTPLTTADLKQAASLVKPSAMREVQFEVPKVKWSDIGGQEEVKLKLRQAVEWPITHPEAFERMGIKPPCGCLMYGPPGCSKTMIAKALATESGLNFLAVKGPELFGKYVGESERAVREIFRKARSAAPSIIFFDEIDSLAVERGKSSGGSNVADRVLTQLLTEMDGVVELKGVTIVAATNRPDMIDKALLRPGRFDRILYVPLPDAATRREILQIVARKTPMAPDVSLEVLVTRTQGFSGAELTALCHEAGLGAITESREARDVHMRHFQSAFNTIRPQTTQEVIKFYEDYSSNSGLQLV